MIMLQTLVDRLEYDDEHITSTLMALGEIAMVDVAAFKLKQREIINDFIVNDLLRYNRVCVHYM